MSENNLSAAVADREKIRELERIVAAKVVADEIKKNIENDLKWKYGTSVAILSAGFVALFLGGAALGFNTVKNNADALYELHKDQFKKMTESLDASNATINQESDKVADLETRLESSMSIVRQQQVSFQSTVDLFAQLKSLTPDQQKIVAAVKAEKATTDTLVENSKFTVYIHYRKDNVDSASFAKNVKSKLQDKAFLVKVDTESTISSIAGATANSGPHLDWFPSKDNPDQAAAAESAATRITNLINPFVPPNFGLVVPNQEPGTWNSSQSTYLGLWL